MFRVVVYVSVTQVEPTDLIQTVDNEITYGYWKSGRAGLVWA